MNLEEFVMSNNTEAEYVHILNGMKLNSKIYQVLVDEAKKEYDRNCIADLLNYIMLKGKYREAVLICISLFEDNKVSDTYIDIFLEGVQHCLPYKEWSSDESRLIEIISVSYTFTDAQLAKLGKTFEEIYAKLKFFKGLLITIYKKLYRHTDEIDLYDAKSVQQHSAYIAYSCTTYNFNSAVGELKSIKQKLNASKMKQYKTIVNYYIGICGEIFPDRSKEYIRKAADNNFRLARIYLDNEVFHFETSKTV